MYIIYYICTYHSNIIVIKLITSLASIAIQRALRLTLFARWLPGHRGRDQWNLLPAMKHGLNWVDRYGKCWNKGGQEKVWSDWNILKRKKNKSLYLRRLGFWCSFTVVDCVINSTLNFQVEITNLITNFWQLWGWLNHVEPQFSRRSSNIFQPFSGRGWKSWGWWDGRNDQWISYSSLKHSFYALSRARLLSNMMVDHHFCA